jgi:4-hydroxy-4-methyl-2-oxoglutarate aldolase
MGAAALGDLLLGMAQNRGVVAVVTDGCVRELDSIETVGLPCFAAGITPDPPNCAGPGSVGLGVDLGGRRIEAGDVMLGDRDGVVVVPFARIDATISALKNIRTAKASLEARVRDGLGNVDAAMAVMKTASIREVD